MLQKQDKPFIHNLCEQLREHATIPESIYEQYNVKRGLRNADGTGVLAGCTRICNVHGYVLNEGERESCEGELTYRGYSVTDLTERFAQEDRFGYEETAFLLLFGKLPTREELAAFHRMLDSYIDLPEGFPENQIMTSPSPDVMNKLAACVLALYTTDPNPDDISYENVAAQCVSLIARIPSIAVSAYQVKKRHYDKDSLYFHYPQKGFSMAENLLHMLRPDTHFTKEEARLLDLCLILHMEHGGGNNSTFVTRMLTSSGTDTYSAIAGAIGSLKGPRHGGANAKVIRMVDDIKDHVENWDDSEEVGAYLRKIVEKKAGDGSGLIYGMGHAVYTLSDPRAVVLKRSARRLAEQKGMQKELRLLEQIEELTPQVFREVKGSGKAMCANVDLYSGFVYRMLGIPEELNTPLFAAARIVGWSAHRLEELMTGNRLIRPAYKALFARREYLPPEQRETTC